MEKKVSSLRILNIVVCVLLLVAFVLFLGMKRVKAEALEGNQNMVLPSVKLGETYPSLIKVKVNEIKKEKKQIVYDLDYYIETNKETISFFSKMFDFNLDDIIFDLKNREKENTIFLSTNLGYLKDDNGNLKIYNNLEYGLIEYFYDLIKNNSKLRHSNYEPYNGSADYVEKLVMYFSSIYSNVDMVSLLSIGAAESGYYKVAFMLRYNNVYGGMGSNGLIKHNNIELGVLSFVRMMSRNYYGKGLTTLSSIGSVYCPSYENGYKTASSHWINLVNTAKNKYKDYQANITINDLINKNEIL